MWISPKPMVDGFVKIFDEFRNGCDEKSDTISPQDHDAREITDGRSGQGQTKDQPFHTGSCMGQQESFHKYKSVRVGTER